jgi:hypothetical protein
MKPPTPAAPTALSTISRTACCGLLALTAALAGCDPTEPKPLRPAADAAAAPTNLPPPPVADASLPDARSSLATGGDGNRASPPGTSARGTLTTHQESTQMPLPGQANNHSLPDSAQRAGQGNAAASAAAAVRPASAP